MICEKKLVVDLEELWYIVHLFFLTNLLDSKLQFEWQLFL